MAESLNRVNFGMSPRQECGRLNLSCITFFGLDGRLFPNLAQSNPPDPHTNLALQPTLNCSTKARICAQHRFDQVTDMANATNPLRFIQQVRAEVAKVVWPTRREVLLTTGMVFVMATLTAIFFFFVDLLIRTGLQGLLGMFG